MSIQESYLKYRTFDGPLGGVFSWIFSTDHKRIALLYLYSIMTFFLVGVVLGFMLKHELKTAEFDFLMTKDGTSVYNQIFTVHGIIMIFMVVIPGIPAILGNFLLPIMIGAKDVAFPRLNNFSWWLYVAGAVIALFSIHFGLDLTKWPDTGWTFYAPYSTAHGSSMILATLAAFVLGFSSILTGLNFIVTIHRLRAEGMTWFRMPLFPWSLYATAWIQLLATPVVGITLLMLIAEKVLQVGFFNPDLGGDPILYEHLFWIYSHPAVYVMILPAMGVVTEIIPTFAKKTIFGYKAIAFSSLAIAFVGFFVWAHHMYTSGMSDTARWVFSLLTFLVAIPSAIKVFNWLATMYKGSIDLQPPLLYTIAFIFFFMIGGLTGLVLGSLATNIHVHDTAFIVAHFHYIIFGGLGFAFFGAFHNWFPKIWGRMYNKKIANISWGLKFIGFNLLYFPMFIAGLEGLPRRYASYNIPKSEELVSSWQTANIITYVGAILLILGIITMIINFTISRRKGEIAGKNPWGGSTLEWQVASPPPHENFDEDPVITRGAYHFE